jgi:hypothetical protein
MLKQWIRKWLLPIPEDQTELVKAIVHTEMLAELQKLFRVTDCWGQISTTRDLQAHITNAAAEAGRDAGESVVRDAMSHIATETFLDQVVDRINRKQLGGQK